MVKRLGLGQPSAKVMLDCALKGLFDHHLRHGKNLDAGWN
jgi:hypothetical protein